MNYLLIISGLLFLAVPFAQAQDPSTATDSSKYGKALGRWPSDQYQASWDLSGASQDVMLLYMIGASLSSSRDFPNWNPGNEFKATRDASMAITR